MRRRKGRKTKVTSRLGTESQAPEFPNQPHSPRMFAFPEQPPGPSPPWLRPQQAFPPKAVNTAEHCGTRLKARFHPRHSRRGLVLKRDSFPEKLSFKARQGLVTPLRRNLCLIFTKRIVDSLANHSANREREELFSPFARRVTSRMRERTFRGTRYALARAY